MCPFHLLFLRDLHVDALITSVRLILRWHEAGGLLLFRHGPNKAKKIVDGGIGCLDVNDQSRATDPDRVGQLSSTLHEFNIINTHSRWIEEHLLSVVSGRLHGTFQ